MDEQFLKIGDHISLLSEEDNGFVTTSGFAEIRVCLTRCKAGEPSIPSFQDAVFEVHALKNYAAQTAFQSALEGSGMELERPSRIDEHHELGDKRAAMETERRNNGIIQERSLGQFVVYGQTIELQHTKSGKFLQVSEMEAAEGDKDALAAQVGASGESGWFKVLPRFKVHSEGERVHVGDKILLLNVKTHHYLYTNNEFDVDGDRIEVNGFTGLTGFKVLLFQSFTSKDLTEACLNGGEIVRFYSKENDGFLMLDNVDRNNPDDPVAHVFCSEDGRTSSNTLFRVERRKNYSGDLVSWEDNEVRLRHIGTGLYLGASTKRLDEVQVGQDILQFYDVFLTHNYLDDATLFRMEALYPNESEGYVRINASFRLRSAVNEAYLHVTDSYWDARDGGGQEEQSGMIGVQQVFEERCKLQLCSKALDEDSLMVVRVRDEEMTNINIVKAVVDLLSNYYKLFDARTFPQPSETKRVQRVLRDLIFFVQKVPDDKLRSDPLSLEEPTDAARQKVIKEQGIIDIVLQILRAPFDPRDDNAPMVTLADCTNKVEFKPFHYTCQLCYRLLKQVIKDNEECERYVSQPHIVDFMQGQLGYQLKTADTLMELFRNNRWLLERLKDSNIAVFFDLIKSVGKLSRYMNFLNALVTCYDEGLPTNQRKICTMLLETHANHCLINIKMEGGAVMVDLESTKLLDKQGQPQWLPVADFLTQCPKEQLNYLERLLTCFSNLALGRTKVCADMVSRFLPFDLCFAVATDSKLDSKALPLQAAFLRVLRTVYVDRDPHVNHASLNTTRVWGKFSQELPAFEGEAAVDVQPVKQFLAQWLRGCVRQVATDESRNNMTLSVLELLEDLLRFGFYGTVKEMEDVIPQLVECLDGRDDLYSHDDDVHDPAHAELRYQQNARNLVIMECKYKILNIFEVIACLRADYRLNQLLLLFQNKWDAGQYKSLFETQQRSLVQSLGHTVGAKLFDVGEQMSRLAGKSGNKEDAAVEKIFARMQFVNRRGEKPVEVLLDCTKYDYAPLVREAFRTLIRNFNQRQLMFDSLSATQLLISDQSEVVYNTVRACNETITSRIGARMSPQEEGEVLKALGVLEAVALDQGGKPNPTNQQILRSAGVHDVVHRLLRLPFSDDLPKEKGRREIFLSCYRLLKNFALGNAPNQAILLNHVEFYMSQMGARLKAADTLTEIFRDNRQVCSQIAEKTIRHFVTIIAERGRFPRYLRFFQIITMPEGRPLKRNQDLILKVLLEKADRVLVLFNDDAGKHERQELIAANDHHTNAEGTLNYHIELLNLLAAIVAGHNHLSEAKCQALLTLQHCCDHVCDASLPAAVRAPWIEFTNECHLETEKVFDMQKEGKAVWLMLEACCGVLEGMAGGEVDEGFVAATSKMLNTFYSKIYLSHSKRNQKATDTTLRLARALVGVAARLTKPSTHAAAVDALTTLRSCRVEPEQMIGIVPPNLLASRKLDPPRVSAAAEEERQREGRVRKALAKFVDDYAASTGLHKGMNSNEYKQLVEIFLDDDVEQTQLVPPTLPSPSAHPRGNWGERNGCTIKLMALVANTRGDTQLKKMALRVLRDLAQFSNAVVDAEMSQNRLDKLGEYSDKKYAGKTFGATTLVLRMLSDDKHQDVTKEALELGVALMDEGNDQVQRRLYDHFANDNSGKVFESVRDLIRRACEELGEKKAHAQRVAEVLAASEGQDEERVLQSLPVYHERAHALQLFRFIQLTCEGHNLKIQNYWRVQEGSVRSYDLVTETSHFVQEAQKVGVSLDNVDAVIQCLETLTELMQGPCKGNQTALSTSKMPSCCNRLLALHASRSDSPKWLQLHESIATTLVALLEGCRNPTVPINIANEFEFDHVFALLERDDDLDENELEMCFAIHGFLLSMREYVPDVRAKMEEHADGLRFFDSNTGHIEIAHDGELERVFFRIPDICHSLTERSKQLVLWNVDRSGPGKKVEDFMSYAQGLEDEMHHQESLKHNRLFKALLLINFDHWGTTIAFWLAFVINFVMFFHFNLPQSYHDAVAQADEMGCNDDPPPEDVDCPDIDLDSFDTHIDEGWAGLVIFLGVVLTLVELLRFVFFVSQFGILIVKKGFDDHGLAPPSKDSSPLERLRALLLAAVFLGSNTKFVTTLALFVFAILGLAVKPLFFAFHLLNTVEMSIDLKNVLRAVTQNGKSLAITAIFGVMVVYLFAIWGFLSFRTHYETDDGDLLCLNLMQCTITTLNGGLRKGDVGEIMSDTEWGNPGLILFQLAYFAVVITILLNIIFGIIIDTFGELRQNKAEVEDDMANKCFICSIDRYTFDRYTDGFETHIKKEHNMWQYVFFLVHLNIKDENDFTGAESYVKAKADANEATWFPVNQAIKLLEHHAKQEEAQNALFTEVARTARRTNELDKKIDKVLQLVQQQQQPEAGLARGRSQQVIVRSEPSVGRV